MILTLVILKLSIIANNVLSFEQILLSIFIGDKRILRKSFVLTKLICIARMHHEEDYASNDLKLLNRLRFSIFKAQVHAFLTT